MGIFPFPHFFINEIHLPNMSLPELPKGLALLICDTLIEDMRTKKKSLIGLFSQITAKKFPYIHPSMTLFISMTGAKGEFKCTLACNREEDGESVISVPCKMETGSPRDVADLVVSLRSMRFTKPGRYMFRVLVDGVPVMMRPLNVVERSGLTSEPQEPGENAF
ncbi:MAG: hypothetical protein IJJ33_11720 [Victivallales bacterium]|nr:hypothetical protein [Victivallales bacterium]